MIVPRFTVEVTEDERAVIEAALRDYRPSYDRRDAHASNAGRAAELLAKELTVKFRVLGIPKGGTVSAPKPTVVGEMSPEYIWPERYINKLTDLSPAEFNKQFQQEYPRSIECNHPKKRIFIDTTNNRKVCGVCNETVK